MLETGKERRKPRSISERQYARTVGRKVAEHFREILKFAATYAAARLRQSQDSAHLSDLVPGKENAEEIAAEAFKKLLSGERRDWDGKTETLHRAIGSCVNSILSSRLRRSDNRLTTPIEDTKLEWLYGDKHRLDPYLEPAEEIANRQSQARIIRRLFPTDGYQVEAEILSTMIIHRAFNIDVIAALTGMGQQQISNAFMRLASYTRTDEFAIRHAQVFGDRGTGPDVYEIRSLAAEITGGPAERD